MSGGILILAAEPRIDVAQQLWLFRGNQDSRALERSIALIGGFTKPCCWLLLVA